MWYRIACCCLVLAPLAMSCQPTPPPPSPPPQPNLRENETLPGITVEAEGMPPEHKQAVAQFARKLVSDAVHEAVAKGMEEFSRKLKLSDEAEGRLLTGRYDFGDPDEEGDSLSVYLVMPAKGAGAPETIEVGRDGRALLRYTRAFAAVERPVAFLTRSRTTEGRIVQAELFLTYGADGKWSAVRPTVTHHGMHPGGR